jgi:hypothetical protein
MRCWGTIKAVEGLLLRRYSGAIKALLRRYQGSVGPAIKAIKPLLRRD